MESAGLILPAFVAGLLTFLAPCTLPLLPAYLGFISGASANDLLDPARAPTIRRRVVLNSLFYVLGFSLVFILLGSLFGLGGAAIVKHRLLVARIGGAFIIFFGLYMLGLFRLPLFRFFASERRIHPALKPGNPGSSFVFGATFAFGWSPCIGPILGSILLLASSSTTVGAGAFLLFVFSLGLAIPFILAALAIGSMGQYLRRLGRALHVISIVGGVFLILLGVLLLTDNFNLWISWFYALFRGINYEGILEYL
ncbi:MAG: sulfite exporter TauE/SafE family protein [Candidatus Kerfeldbacteria bacterium]|nr:sulfite exporter TauE/SafE family protein [Candidatus Kerfeldbacteria bacterium]